MSEDQRRPNAWLYPYKVVRARLRLFGALAFGVACLLLLPLDAPLILRCCIAWDLAVLCYLALFGWVLAHCTVVDIARQAAAQDEGRIGVLVLTGAAAFASLAAIFVQLGDPAEGDAWHVLLLIATTLLSWTFTHTIFAIHYAHEYYDESDGSGLSFPGDQKPDYWDFLYFSFVVGMTAQVSDVQVLTQPWRRLVLAHGILSFLFNTVVLALSINLFAAFFQDSGGK